MAGVHLTQRQLKIGISSCFFHADPQRPIFKGKTLLYMEQSLAHWIMSEGALVYLIPTVEAGSPNQTLNLVRELDGLVLQGGADVSPKSYGEEPLRPEWSGDYVRDRYEISLVREFIAQGKPVFGVCRGAQLLNVAFGGTLYQDIQTQLPECIQHRNWEIYDQNFHQIRFEPGSNLGRLYPCLAGGKVNSIHHQALKELGNGLVVEARCEEDGVVEAIRLQPHPYVFAVQWHPEFHNRDDQTLLDCQRLLVDFLNEARLSEKRRRSHVEDQESRNG